MRHAAAAAARDVAPDWARGKNRFCLTLLLFAALAASQAFAELTVVTAPTTNPNQAVSTAARLDFTIVMDKFLFFRIGAGAFPTASSSIDTVTFNTVAAIPTAPATPADGNNTPANWSGAVPSFSAPSSVLPVEIRSNAGQVTLRATATTPLTSGANSIPLSSVVVTSSDPNVPAPLIPNSGSGPVVNVTGTAFSNLVTVRNANWTFSYNNPAPAIAGTYTGQITFTASAP